MHEKLPAVSGYETIKAFTRLGFAIVRRRGSHVVLQKGLIIFTVPLHRTLKKGTFHAILKQSGVSIEELRKVL